MVNTETARTVIGVLGNVISFLLFVSPLPTFVKICKQKSVQDFKPDPYVATILNCALWTFYGLPFVHPDSILVVTINGIGFFIEAIYCSIFLVFAPWPKRRKIIIVLLIEAIIFGVIVFITLFALHTTKNRSMLVGILCVVLNIIMYASPLTVMCMVIKTKSVKYMPFYLSLANFCNGCVWVVYACLKFDPYIMVPNSLGTLSGIVQLLLYATFYRTTRWNDDNDNISQPEAELPNTSRA